MGTAWEHVQTERNAREPSETHAAIPPSHLRYSGSSTRSDTSQGPESSDVPILLKIPLFCLGAILCYLLALKIDHPWLSTIGMPVMVLISAVASYRGAARLALPALAGLAPPLWPVPPLICGGFVVLVAIFAAAMFWIKPLGIPSVPLGIALLLCMCVALIPTHWLVGSLLLVLLWLTGMYVATSSRHRSRAVRAITYVFFIVLPGVPPPHSPGPRLEGTLRVPLGLCTGALLLLCSGCWCCRQEMGLAVPLYTQRHHLSGQNQRVVTSPEALGFAYDAPAPRGAVRIRNIQAATARNRVGKITVHCKRLSDSDSALQRPPRDSMRGGASGRPPAWVSVQIPLHGARAAGPDVLAPADCFYLAGVPMRLLRRC